MTGQWAVDCLKLCIGYVEAHPVMTILILFFGGGLPLRFAGRWGGKE